MLEAILDLARSFQIESHDLQAEQERPREIDKSPGLCSWVRIGCILVLRFIVILNDLTTRGAEYSIRYFAEVLLGVSLPRDPVGHVSLEVSCSVPVLT